MFARCFVLVFLLVGFGCGNSGETFDPLGEYDGTFETSDGGLVESTVTLWRDAEAPDKVMFRHLNSWCSATFELVDATEEEMVYDLVPTTCLVTIEREGEEGTYRADFMSGSMILTPSAIDVIMDVQVQETPAVELTFVGEKRE